VKKGTRKARKRRTLSADKLFTEPFTLASQPSPIPSTTTTTFPSLPKQSTPPPSQQATAVKTPPNKQHTTTMEQGKEKISTTEAKDEGSKTKEKGGRREYKPRNRSGPYAILAALYIGRVHQQKLSLNKEEIISLGRDYTDSDWEKV